jgi:hypothetical protein
MDEIKILRGKIRLEGCILYLGTWGLGENCGLGCFLEGSFGKMNWDGGDGDHDGRLWVGV